MIEIILDIALVAALVISSFRAIHAPEVTAGVVAYIVFGLLLALVWVRLEAPDLALAEAAIGAGLTGAILLDAARQMGEGRDDRARPGGLGWVVAGIVAVALGGVLAATAAPLGSRSSSLAAAVVEQLPETGLEYQVTAVLLAFRGYDTFLEIGVLLVAAMATLALRRTASFTKATAVGPAPDVALGAAALIAPAATLLAGYLLWRGSHGPGGAFQAGAVLAAVGVLLTLLGRPPLARFSPRMLNVSLAMGFAVFSLAGAAGIIAGGAFLEHRGGAAKLAFLAIESALALSVGVILLLLFVGGRGGAGSEGDRA